MALVSLHLSFTSLPLSVWTSSIHLPGRRFSSVTKKCSALRSANIPDWPPRFQDSLPLKMTQFDEFSPSFNLATKRDYNVTYIFLSAQIKEIARLRNFHRRRISLFVWNLRMIIWQHVLLSCTRSKNLRDLEKITSAVEWLDSSSKPLNRRIILFNKITRPSYYFPRGRNSS